MAKVFASPGISARPLNVFERLREWWRYDHSLRFRLQQLNWRYNPKYRKQRQAMRSLMEALCCPPGYELWSAGPISVSSGPLQVEDLSATMAVVTFDETKLRLRD